MQTLWPIEMMHENNLWSTEVEIYCIASFMEEKEMKNTILGIDLKGPLKIPSNLLLKMFCFPGGKNTITCEVTYPPVF